MLDGLKIVEGKVPPTPFEQSYYPKSPNVRRFEKIVRFGTIPAVKAGWLLKSKGQWSLTDEGRTAYSSFTDPETFQREAIKLYGAWKEGQPTPEPNDETLETETRARSRKRRRQRGARSATTWRGCHRTTSRTSSPRS